MPKDAYASEAELDLVSPADVRRRQGRGRRRHRVGAGQRHRGTACAPARPKSTVSTIDNANSAFGQVSTALAVAGAINSQVGQYGTAKGAQALFPTRRRSSRRAPMQRPEQIPGTDAAGLHAALASLAAFIRDRLAEVAPAAGPLCARREDAPLALTDGRGPVRGASCDGDRRRRRRRSPRRPTRGPGCCGRCTRAGC